MTCCPCCSSLMLRRVRQGKVYWFCRTCWQEMPVLTVEGQRSNPTAPAPTPNALTLNSVKDGDLQHFFNRIEKSTLTRKQLALAL